MFFETTRPQLYRAVVLLIVIAFTDRNNAKEISCQGRKEPNSMVDIIASKHRNESTEVLADLRLSSESSCQDLCCSHVNCTLYVYYEGPNRPNCFLLKCTPTDNCVRKEVNGSFVGVIERNNLVQDKLHTVSTVTSKDGVMLETTLSERPIGSTISAVQQNQQRGEVGNSKSNSSSPDRITATALITTYHSSATPPTQDTSLETKATSPQVKLQKIKSKTQVPEHTNKTSLIIALFFGILFLLAILVIVGRPWWDFMHRPRYSKVDYLMNGI